MKLKDVIIDMHQGINTVADKVDYVDYGISIIQSKNFTKGFLDLNDVRYLGQEDESKYIDKYNPHVGDILMANIGTIGKTFVIEKEERFLIAWNAFLFKPNNELVKSKFLKFYFDYLLSIHYYDKLLTGGTVKFINKKKISEIPFPHFTLNEQEKIIERLSLVEKIIVKRGQQLQQLDELVKARFVEMFGTIHNNKFGYEIKTLQDVCEQIKDGTHQTPTYTDDSVNGYKFLSSKDVTTGKIDWTHLKYIPAELHNELYTRIAPKKGDILLAKNGTTGIAAIVDRDEIFDIYVSLALLRPIEINSIYLWAAINSVETKQQFDSNLKGIGVPNLHLGEIKKARIVVPPIEEQNQFATFVEQVDKSKVAVQKALDEAQTLFDSLMQQYFG